MRHIYYIIPFLILTGLMTSCHPAKLSTAEAQYERGEYYQAAATFRKVYNKTSPTKERPLRGKIAQLMGNCYLRLNMGSRASAAYTNALRYKNPDSTIYLSLGRSLQMEGRYKDAITNYQHYLKCQPDSKIAQEGIAGSEEATTWKKNKTRFQVAKSTIFNLRRADFSPMLLGKDGDQLYFTTSTDKATGTDKSDITGTKPCDIYFSKKNEKGVWQRPEPAEGELNTEFDEGTPAFSPDGSTIYFTRARKDTQIPTTTEIFTASRTGGKWGAASKLEISNDTISLFAHPAVSPDGKYLYFVSDMPGGYGGKDIWRATLTTNGIGSYENLGEQINTEGDEMFPTFRHDGILYFSSNGHAGMGGLDIFSAREDEWGTWHIQNLQAPINSNGDDFGMTFFNQEEEQGFFSSNRNDGRGFDHIYSFYRPSIKVLITGAVENKDEEPIAGAVVRVVGRDGSNNKVITKDDGSFEIKIDRGVEYVMMAGASGYLNDKEEFSSDSDEADATYEVRFQLASINKPVLIDNIFYDFDKASLRPESCQALDKLIQLLNDNPNVTIELAAHTDRMGSDEYNKNLSQRRADAVIQYLIKGGIVAERLTPVGYGKSVPKTVSALISKRYPFFPEGQILNEEFIQTLNPEQQEIADQINRRTEFQVKEITYGLE